MATDTTDETSSEVSEISESTTRVVQFKNVSVREYNRIVGDHPDCKFGPPMALGWGHVELEPIDIDEYETIKPSTRRKGSMKLMSFARRRILHEEFCIPEKDLFNPHREENMFEETKTAKKKKGIMRSIRKRLSKVGKCVVPSAEVYDHAEEDEEDQEDISGESLLKEKWVSFPVDGEEEDTSDDDDSQSYEDDSINNCDYEMGPQEEEDSFEA